MAADVSRLFLLGISHDSVPLPTREALYLSQEGRERVYAQARQIPELKELLIVSTCNRIEYYAVGNSVARRALLLLLEQFYALKAAALEALCALRYDQAVLEHLFAVCTGLRSQLLGETEIVAQLKEAYAEARLHNGLGPVLNRAVQKALQASKWCRTHTGIGRRPVSIGSVASTLALRIFGALTQCRVLILGGGNVAQEVTKALKSRGATNITISARNAASRDLVAQQLAIHTLHWSSLPKAILSFDIILACTKAPKPILDSKTLQDLIPQRTQPWLFIDLGFPRNIDPDLRTQRPIYLYDLEDLAQVAEHNRHLRSEDLQTCYEYLSERALVLSEYFLKGQGALAGARALGSPPIGDF